MVEREYAEEFRLYAPLHAGGILGGCMRKGLEVGKHAIWIISGLARAVDSFDSEE